MNVDEIPDVLRALILDTQPPSDRAEGNLNESIEDQREALDDNEY